MGLFRFSWLRIISNSELAMHQRFIVTSTSHVVAAKGVFLLNGRVTKKRKEFWMRRKARVRWSLKVCGHVYSIYAFWLLFARTNYFFQWMALYRIHDALSVIEVIDIHLNERDRTTEDMNIPEETLDVQVSHKWWIKQEKLRQWRKYAGLIARKKITQSLLYPYVENRLNEERKQTVWKQR